MLIDTSFMTYTTEFWQPRKRYGQYQQLRYQQPGYQQYHHPGLWYPPPPPPPVAPDVARPLQTAVPEYKQ